MPILDIPPERISNPIRLDLGQIDAVMLYPDKPETRDHVIEFCMSEEFAGMLEDTYSKSGRCDQLIPASVATFLRYAPRQGDFNVRDRLKWGTVAGMVLYDIVARYGAGIGGSGIGPTVTELNDRLKLGVSDASAQRWWRAFRPVAHLWAARQELCYRVSSDGKNESPFPCQLNQLAEFLGYSEFFRQRGESIKTPRAPGPVLPPGEAFVPPPGELIPRAELEFSAT